MGINHDIYDRPSCYINCAADHSTGNDRGVYQFASCVHNRCVIYHVTTLVIVCMIVIMYILCQ